MLKPGSRFVGAALVGLVLLAGPACAAQKPITWSAAQAQPDSWYGGAEAARIADSVLQYQFPNGGWEKNIEMTAPPKTPRASKGETTIDNGATFTQIRFLARVYAKTGRAVYKDAVLSGLDFLLAAQYPNGGWPQFYPLRKGYYTHITFNDNAMAGVLTLLRDVGRGDAPFGFVDSGRRARAVAPVDRGVDCILRCQVVVDGKKTVWCAQHDERTFAPAPARAYEKISLSGSESVGLVRFLMGIEKPSPEVKAAIEAALAWFVSAKLNGIKVVEKPDPTQPKGTDRVVVADPKASPLWARFYEIGTNRPIFCGRDGIIKYSLAEIEAERRNGYRWYVDSPSDLLEKDAPAWRRRN